jgi:hypothetical protein
MNAYTHFADARACCAFCVKPLPIVNGELQPWRAANGQFFCNEFCADDAEEALFQSHHRGGAGFSLIPAPLGLSGIKNEAPISHMSADWFHLRRRVCNP